jgi:hypothetical protein
VSGVREVRRQERFTFCSDAIFSFGPVCRPRRHGTKCIEDLASVEMRSEFIAVETVETLS